jgi:hypothetical protein
MAERNFVRIIVALRPRPSSLRVIHRDDCGINNKASTIPRRITATRSIGRTEPLPPQHAEALRLKCEDHILMELIMTSIQRSKGTHCLHGEECASVSQERFGQAIDPDNGQKSRGQL